MARTAVQHLIDQYRIALRADKVAKAVRAAVRKDPDLRAWGVQFLRRDAEFEVPPQFVGLDIQWVSLGGQLDPSRITARTVKPSVDYLGFHIEELYGKAFEKRTWETLERLACQQMIERLKHRIRSLLQAAEPDLGELTNEDVLEFTDWFHFAVWIDESDTQAWLPHGEDYFHVQMRLPLAGFAAMDLVSSRDRDSSSSSPSTSPTLAG